MHQTTKGTLLRQIWSNKSFGVCGSDVVLTLESDEKKSTRESPLEIRCRCYRAVVIRQTSLRGEKPQNRHVSKFDIGAVKIGLLYKDVYVQWVTTS